jgi:signal transduction histidine kinase
VGRLSIAAVFSRLSLRGQLAALCCVALLPGFALLFWIRGEVRALEREDANESAMQLAQLVAEAQISRTYGVEQLIATFAAIPDLRSPDPAACSAFLRDLVRRSSTGYLNFGLLSADGRVQCTAIGPPGFSLADNPAFKEAMRTNDLTITPIVRGRLIGRDIFSYMRRVQLDDGTTRVVFVGFDLETVGRSLAHVPLPPGAVLGVLRTDGEVIAAYPPEGRALMRGLGARIGAIHASPFSEMQRDDAGVTRAFAGVRLAAPDNLVAVAALPSSAAAADRRILTAVVIFGASSLITLLVALLVANHGIRHPIQRLLDAMTRVRQGEFDARIAQSDGCPEVRALADGFDEMTAQLERREERTRQAQRMEAVGQLAGGIAHDFNNMLTVIIGFGEELRDHVRDAGRTQLAEVLGAAARARDLTQQLLAFSRRQVLNTEPVQLNDTLRTLSRMLERIIGEHITLDLHLAGRLPLIRVDRAQLEQVITNLVVNARDAMGEGGRLSIRTDTLVVTEQSPVRRRDVPAGRYTRLSVADTGHGMDAETLSHVFEPFFTTKVDGRGTGLGLATVYGIVSQSGGYVVVDSAPRGGTTFEIYFPALAAEAIEPTVAPVTAPQRGAGQTILVVEDEPGVRRLTVTILRRAGYRVLEAANAAQAEDIARTEGSHLTMLLTDVVLPGGPSGVVLGRTLTAQWPDLVVVHMSGYSRELSSLAPDEDRVPFLRKPFTPAALLKAVADALNAGVAQAGTR